MSASFLLRCTGVTCYTPRCLALGACERDELATLHGVSPSKVPTVAFAFGPKRGSNARQAFDHRCFRRDPTLGACERDELATLHGVSPSKVPTVAFAFGPKRGSNARQAFDHR